MTAAAAFQRALWAVLWGASGDEPTGLLDVLSRFWQWATMVVMQWREFVERSGT